MKRVLTIALVLMLLLAATPAMAARGGKPRPHGTFDVTLSGVLNSTCSGDTLTMTGTVPGTLRADLPLVALDLPIHWQRTYDAGWQTSAELFEGCHGISASALDTDSYGGALIIEVDAGGKVTSVIFLFDYYWQFGENPKNGRPVQQVLEMFSLKSDGTGTFTVTLFTKEGKDIVNDWIPVGSSEGTLTATITPAG